MHCSQRGFTMIEMVVTVMVGAILLTIAIRAFGNTSSRLATDNARQSFAALQARTRVHAVERGELVRLNIDPAGDSAWIQAAGVQVDRLDFMESRGVDVQSSTAGIIALCMNPRGFAETTCNSFGGGTVDLSFTQGSETSTIRILPLGQLSW